MAKPKKDGQFINCYLDRTLYNRLCYYSEQKGQTKTLAIERILKEHFDKEGIPVESCGRIPQPKMPDPVEKEGINDIHE